MSMTKSQFFPNSWFSTMLDKMCFYSFLLDHSFLPRPKTVQKDHWLTGCPRAICGQRYLLPCIAWLSIVVRGSRAGAPKGMKSFRIQGDFCLSILPFIPPGPLRPEIYPLRHDIYPLRPEICSQTLNLDPFGAAAQKLKKFGCFIEHRQ